MLTLPNLFDIISDTYSPCPNVIHLKEIYNFKRYILDGGEGNVKVLAQLNNISFNHVFLIKQNETSGCTLLYIKRYSSSPQWEPEGGHGPFLLNMPSAIDYGAKQMPIETKKDMHSELIEEQRNLWKQALSEEKKHIDISKKYSAQQDILWWVVFCRSARNY